MIKYYYYYNFLLGTGCVRLPDGLGGLVRRHPDFRLFCCMNPSTDVGKRDLPPALAARMARCHVQEPEAETDLAEVVQRYFKVLRPVKGDDDESFVSDERCRRVVRFYRSARKAARTRLCDGAGRRPCYSLRTLCRAMTIAVGSAPIYSPELCSFTSLVSGPPIRRQQPGSLPGGGPLRLLPDRAGPHLL